MKKKYFLVIFVLILTMFLVGCSGGGLVTPATDEALIKSVIQEYYLAISGQNWSKAKSYCIYGSDRYYATCQMEELANTFYLYCNIVTVNVVVNILDVSINGNYSQAYCKINYLISYCGNFESDSGYAYYNLQKAGNSWKFDSP